MRWAAAVLASGALALVPSVSPNPRRETSPDVLTAAAASLMNEARLKGDVALYRRAEEACDRALEIDPAHYDALRLRGWIYGGEHRFAEAAQAARRAQAVRPDDPFNFGALGDALVETGDYAGAETAFQKMIDLRPDSASYARGAYFRELTGDNDGAIELMSRALDAAVAAGPAERAWYLSQRGDLRFARGGLSEAAADHGAAVALAPQAPWALAGLARDEAALDHDERAIALDRRSLEILPSPLVAAELATLLERRGRADEARAALALVEATKRLREDRQIAMIDADRGHDVEAALGVAERSLVSRHDIYGYDAVAWCAFKAGHLARARETMSEALKLGTEDARLFFHAGMIANAAGDRAEARRDLAHALRLNARFDPSGAEVARRTLREIS
ncbi:MAG TPA: tetratricopeptide repeat protein [Candidatus Polarisedimenticolaceae bacterium]|nr:tetratricopeptide repeat protein [Candidatus Polarisedimenticolaceae bacterium]